MIDRRPLYDKNETLRSIVSTVYRRADDLRLYGFDQLPFEAWFDIVRKIPYRQDIYGREIVARPGIILQGSAAGADCKKKAVLIASWCELNKVRWRLITSSRRPDKKIHHVFPQIFVGDTWINADATYPQYSIGQQKKVTNFEVYKK